MPVPNSSRRQGFTLVEMLVAMSLTLLMMAAVIGVFANVSESVANRRASIEMSTQLRHARTLLQADLANHTCPAQTWTKPESNHGYIEIVEGPQTDFDPSIWLRDENNDGVVDPVGPSGNQLQIDLAVSQLPSTNLYSLPGSFLDANNDGKNDLDVRNQQYVTDGGALGDWDDVLMLTVRNDDQPFVGRVPSLPETDLGNGQGFVNWGATEIESPIAEVVWFAVENPVEPSDDRTFYFGEPGFRTVYRRVLLVAPQLDYDFVVNNQDVGAGVVRVLPAAVTHDEPDQAISALIAFQEQYDLSVRIEWNPLLASGRWVIKANTLGDLTKRENRYEHANLPQGTPGSPLATYQRWFPFLTASRGRGVPSNVTVRPGRLVEARPLERPDDGNITVTPDETTVRGRTQSDGSGMVQLYSRQGAGVGLGNRPYVYVDDPAALKPTTRAIVNEDGEVVMFTNGMVPLSGDRRGEDVVLSNMLAFDVKVYDPQAPLLAEIADNTDSRYPGEVVSPGEGAWGQMAWGWYAGGLPGGSNVPIAGRGAYVDLGYVGLHASFAVRNDQALNGWQAAFDAAAYAHLVGNSEFAEQMNDRSKLEPFPNSTYGGYAFQPYRTYDTWSTSYESNGKDENTNGVRDEGTNGFDDDGLNGVDDPGERETAPPYDAPLRGLQVTLRAYELDSRQIREVNVKQTFVPK